MQRHIPNLLTCCNLLCGCLGIVFVLEGRTIPAAYFIWAAAGFDFLDGFAARLLKVSSSIGKELDSLADVVSFGLLPAFVMYKFWSGSATDILAYTSFSIAIFSALRLAIFNVDDTQKDSFRGLPTPANALLISSLPLLSDTITSILQQPWIFLSIVVVSSFLLVSPINLFALKFKNFGWQENKIRFSFILISIALVGLLNVSAIPLIILLYVVLSLGLQVVSK